MQEDRPGWRAACEAELAMLTKLNTWTLVAPSLGVRPIATKWVFTWKWAGEGYTLQKARLVAKGFVQRPGRDYGETYAPVTSLTTVRCLLSIAAARGYFIWQCDVKNAFLHGDIDRDVYLCQPPGFTDGTSRV